MNHSRSSSRALTAAKARRAAREWTDEFRPVGKQQPAVCTECKAAHSEGRWRWQAPGAGAVAVTCPACHRARHRIAAHVIELGGALPPWWNEVRGMIGNVERAEVSDHPMERVLAIDMRDDRVLVSTTGLHIARRLVAAFLRRFRQQIRLTFADLKTMIDWLEAREAR
jgi:hypothetical protein